MSNHLQYETSPYLKQHQNNPVNWYPWGKIALDKAQKEQKLIIVSIGYTACHWCHVMERESFESKDVAQVMNAHFVSVKVDREERPDIDQVYMTAVQLMTNSGGWPLHCICLPDGRPIYGGTYFRPHDWINVLQELQHMWITEPNVAYDYADRLSKGIRESEVLPVSRIPERYTAADLTAIVEPWRKLFDEELGGYKRAPKFPLPNNWLFFLRYGHLTQDEKLLAQTHFTLKSIAAGGIYDHVGGGFARYSVDEAWHIPHFEKMLYDNAQLVSLFSEAYKQEPVPQYQRVVRETLNWVLREMTSNEGAFYCALDADSEGVEGKYYTFQQEEFEQVLGKDAPLAIHYFSLTREGNWEEEGINVLKTAIDADQMAIEAGFSADEWEDYLANIKAKLLAYRENRVRPGLDNKILTSWNAMMLKAFVDAYRTFHDADYLAMAQRNAEYLLKKLFNAEGRLLHQPSVEGKETLAFLDDYAFTIEAFISLYEATFDIEWLDRARRLADEVLTYFYEEGATAFYFVSHQGEALIARKYELLDNVIPASNSVMVRQLFKLASLFDEPRYQTVAEQILANVFPQIKSYGSAYSNWCIQLLEHIFGTKEIAITGPADTEAFREAIDDYYIPNKLLLGGQSENLPLLKGRVGLKNQIFICENKTCSLPVDNLKDFEQLIFESDTHS